MAQQNFKLLEQYLTLTAPSYLKDALSIAAIVDDRKIRLSISASPNPTGRFEEIKRALEPLAFASIITPKGGDELAYSTQFEIEIGLGGPDVRKNLTDALKIANSATSNWLRNKEKWSREYDGKYIVITNEGVVLATDDEAKAQEKAMKYEDAIYYDLTKEGKKKARENQHYGAR